ncbi:MAG: hypothetical protein Q9161_002086 [Pseudevernia consocians]
MEKLPTEVVCEILGHSELKELKLIRIAFAHSPYGATWIEIAANLLFKQIYFSLGSQAMLRFQNITETKRLQERVRHLIFVDTQLDERLVDNQPSFMSALPGAETMSHAQRIQTYETYCRVFRERQKILDDEEDVALLTKGLDTLPNLNKVSVIGGPSHDLGTTSYLEHGPHAIDVHGIGIKSSYWSYRSKRAPGYHPLDRRPFQNLLRSLCASKTRPTKVELGNWRKYSDGKLRRMGVPISCLNLYCGLGSAMFDTVITTAFGNVTDLNLQLDMNSRPYDPDPAYTERDLSFLFKVLPSLRRLQRLILNFIHWNLLQGETKLLLEGNTWMALKSLSLRRFEISPATFSAFVQNHTSTLTEMFFDEVGLPSGCQDTWQGLISRNIQFLNLKAARFKVYEIITTEDGSDDYAWIAEDLLLKLLFRNEKGKGEKVGKNEDDGVGKHGIVMDIDTEGETMQEDGGA